MPYGLASMNHSNTKRCGMNASANAVANSVTPHAPNRSPGLPTGAQNSSGAATPNPIRIAS